MLHLVDEALERFLRASVPMAVDTVDVVFQAPDRTWGASISRPTVNLFLFDVRRSGNRAVAGIEEVEIDGVISRRPAFPRMELRYLLTAWTADLRDEHQLLGSAMRAVLATKDIPVEFLPPPLDQVFPLPGLSLAQTGAENQADLWNALDGQLKPGLDITVELTVDPGLAVPAGPPTTAVELELSDKREPTRRARVARLAGRVTDPSAVGARVITRRGSSVVEPSGSFLVPAEPGDELTIDTDPPRVITIPPDGVVEVD